MNEITREFLIHCPRIIDYPPKVVPERSSKDKKKEKEAKDKIIQWITRMNEAFDRDKSNSVLYGISRKPQYL